MLKLWRADMQQLQPVLVDCPNGGHPNSDADGERIFANTHFKSIDMAWEQLEDECLADVSLCGRAVKRAEEELIRRQMDAADAAKRFATLRENQLAQQVESQSINSEQPE